MTSKKLDAIERMIISSIMLILSLSMAMDAHATPTPPKPDPKQHTSARADADSYSMSRSTSDASASARQSQQQSQTATGGSSEVDVSNDISNSASTDGNAQSVDFNTPRQVPPVFLPALMVSECGAGANAGAADGGGAGAFGVVWTTKRCYALRSAINFFAIGEYETGCRLLVYVNREALEAIGEKPDCKRIAAVLHLEAGENLIRLPPDAPPVDLSKFATKEEVERAFKKSQSK